MRGLQILWTPRESGRGIPDIAGKRVVFQRASEAFGSLIARFLCARGGGSDFGG